MPRAKSIIKAPDPVKPSYSELTTKQRAFVEEYLTNGRNSVQAYISAYPGTQMTYEESQSMSRRMLKIPKIRALIEKANQVVEAKTDKVIQRYAITQERVLEEIAKIAFADVRDVAYWDHARGVILKGADDLGDKQTGAISEIRTDQHGRVTVKHYDKIAALTLLAKHLGMMVEKHDHRHLVAAKFVIEDA